MENKELIERYPFLAPRDWFTGEVKEGYNYEYTLLDEMPHGWRIAFGEDMCEEIRESLIRNGCLKEYLVEQIKEKYGSLCWYGVNGVDEVEYEIIPKYEKISAKTCIECGSPATKISKGWIRPYCDACAKQKGVNI